MSWRVPGNNSGRVSPRGKACLARNPPRLSLGRLCKDPLHPEVPTPARLTLVRDRVPRIREIRAELKGALGVPAATAAGVAGGLAEAEGSQEVVTLQEMARRLGRVSVAVAVALVLVWSLVGVALCRGRAWADGPG